MVGLLLPCPPGREDGHVPLGFFWKGAATCPARCAQAPGGSEPPRRCRGPAPLPPAGSHGHGEIWPSRLLRRGNLFRASRRDRSLKASQLRGPSPPPATSSPRLRRERVNHWVGLLVLQGPIKRGQGPPSAGRGP